MMLCEGYPVRHHRTATRGAHGRCQGRLPFPVTAVTLARHRLDVAWTEEDENVELGLSARG